MNKQNQHEKIISAHNRKAEENTEALILTGFTASTLPKHLKGQHRNGVDRS